MAITIGTKFSSELWRHDRIHTQALSKERTGENGDVKRVLVKFLALTNWNTGVVRSAGAADGETELRAERETRGIELSCRMRWVSILPSSIGTVTKPRVTMGEKLNSGTTVVTQLRCHGNSETARVHGVRCRVVNEASLKHVVA